MASVRSLFRDYETWLGVDLRFQGFESELARLPGKYAAPKGCVLLASSGNSIAGGVGLTPLAGDVCEMKRMFVRPAWQGRGFGRRLAERIVFEARDRGYTHMRLDTLGRLKAALHIYRSIGFDEISAYYENPLEDVIYLELNLAEARLR